MTGLVDVGVATRGEAGVPLVVMLLDGFSERSDGAVWLAALGRNNEGTSSGSVKPGSARS